MEFEIKQCAANDKDYPSGLKKFRQVPELLYYKGDIRIVNQFKNVAVIGGRKASEAGIKLSYETGRMVAQQGMNLVNGLALGCDTEAVKGALSENGRCVAILPCGLEQIQPRTNTALAEEILKKGGCLLSEYPIGTSVQNYRYVERDRLQSGVSQGVLVVEAEEKSGTMHTADFAKSQVKRLACYYHKMLKMASGNCYLENTGKAQVLKSKNDLLNFLQEILDEEEFEQMTLRLE